MSLSRALYTALVAALVGLALAGCAQCDVAGGDGGGADGGGLGDDGGDCGGLSCDAIYVDGATGNDSNAGGRAAPMKTITAGILKAQAASPPRAVFLSTGIYPESVTLADGVSIYGGFSAASGWNRDPDYTTEIHGGTVAVTGTDLTTRTVIDGLRIRSADASGAGESSTAIWLANSDDVQIADCIIEPGNGGDGADGTIGATG